MTTQDIRKGHFKSIEGDGLKALIESTFGTRVEQSADGWLSTSFGAIKSLRVRVLSKAELQVEVESDRTAGADVASATIKKYNGFLESATGFTSKERSKRLQKKAKEGKL